MIEAYRIGVNLVMDPTKVTGPLGLVLKAFENIQAAQRATQAGLNELAAGTRAAASATNNLAAAWRNVADAAASAGRSTAGGPAGTGLRASGGAGPRASGGAGPLIPAGGGAGGPLAPLGGSGSLVPFSGGAGMPPLNYNGGMPGPIFGAGFSLSAAANAISIIDRLVTGIAHLTERAAAFNDALVHLEQRGVSPAATRDLEDTVMKIGATVPGRTFSDITKDAGSLRAVLGESPGGDDLASVKAFLPMVEQTAAAISGGGNITTENALHMLFRAIEMRGGTIGKDGKISPERFKAELEAVYKVLQTAGGIISERDILNVIQQGSVVSKTMNNPDEFWKMILAPLIDQKGSRAGTALQAAGRQLFGGILSKRTAAEFGTIMGFGDHAFTSAGGGGAILKPELMEKIAEDMKGGLLAFIEKDIRPGLIEHGFDTTEKQNAEVFKIAGTDTFRRLLSLFLSNADQVLKEGKLYDKVPPVDDALKLLNSKSIGFNFSALSAAVGNFFEVLEKGNRDNIIGITQALRGFFDRITEGQAAINHLHEGGPSFPPNPLLGPDGKHYLWDRKAWDDKSMAPDGGKSSPEEKHSAVYLDGKKVGMIVREHLADDFSRPMTGGRGSDSRLTPVMPGMATAFG